MLVGVEEESTRMDQVVMVVMVAAVMPETPLTMGFRELLILGVVVVGVAHIIQTTIRFMVVMAVLA